MSSSKCFTWHLYSYEDYLWPKFQLNQTFFTGVIAQKKPKNGPINCLFSCLKKCFPSQQKNLFNVNYSHTCVYFSFVLLTVKILSQTPLFGSFHGAAYFTELLWYDLLNKIFLKCITRGYEFTLIQYLLLHYHNTFSTNFNSEISFCFP